MFGKFLLYFQWVFFSTLIFIVLDRINKKHGYLNFEYGYKRPKII